MNKIFLVQTIVITFTYLLGLFIVQNLKRFLQRIQSYQNAQFLGPKWSICPKQVFFWKIINIILIYLLATFIVQNVKKIIPADLVMRMRNFWAQNGPFLQMRIFFRKPVNVPCFFHSCLSTCQKSKLDVRY